MAEPGADDAGTSTLEAARAHARAQADAAGAAGITVPATAARDLPPGVDHDAVIWDEVVPLGGYASRRVPRGTVVRLEDADGDACVQLWVHRAEHPAERLNVADTVKVQWQAYLGPGALLLSDMGRVLMTIVDDTSARHDCFCTGSTRAANEARYGNGSVWGPTPAARELASLAVAKHGLERRDLPPAVGLFKGVRVADDGGLHLRGEPVAGTHVELRAELDLLVTVTNTPHVLDGRDGYEGSPVRLTAWRTDPSTDDPNRTSTPERARAFLNTDELLAGGAR
jgi:urea carboxylase-associated protein 2